MLTAIMVTLLAATATPPRQVAASQFSKTYENEVAGDDLYKGRRVRMLGVVVGVRKDTRGAAYVALRSVSLIQPVKVYLENDASVASLKKDDLILIDAKGAGTEFGGAVLNEGRLQWVAKPEGGPLAGLSFGSCADKQFDKAVRNAVKTQLLDSVDGGFPPGAMTDEAEEQIDAMIAKILEENGELVRAKMEPAKKAFDTLKKTADKELVKRKLTALPCDDLAVAAVEVCVTTSGSECGHPFLQAADKALPNKK